MGTTKVFIAPFHAASEDSSRSLCGSTIASFRLAVKRQNWPYDNGDDPSFYAARTLGGQLSWGICRQDVRNGLLTGDSVVFFSFRKFKTTGDAEYRLCALATVDRKVSQSDIWRDKSLEIYRKYSNLLIRPTGAKHDSWEHFEPSLQGSQRHGDWLWRIAENTGFRKPEFKDLQLTDRLESGATIRDRPIVIADNYVLFSPDPAKTHILSRPPVIAWHSKGKPREEWTRDAFSQSVRQLTLGVAEQANGRARSLRTENRQQPHRHIVFELPQSEAEQWRADFLELIRGR